jgi:hypothetical protein
MWNKPIIVTDKAPTYRSYLLRLWRASVEIPGLDKRRAFADLAALFAFLEAQTRAATLDHAPDETSK